MGQLLDCKDDQAFHLHCYARDGPYFKWTGTARVEKLGDRTGIELAIETGILPGELRPLGLDYCQNTGQETDYTRSLKTQMDVRWLASG